MQIRPHYYTVFPAFPQHNLSRSPNIPPYSSNFLSSCPNIRQSLESKNECFLQYNFHQMNHRSIYFVMTDIKILISIGFAT